MKCKFELTLDLDEEEVPKYVALAIEEDLAEIYQNPRVLVIGSVTE